MLRHNDKVLDKQYFSIMWIMPKHTENLMPDLQHNTVLNKQISCLLAKWEGYTGLRSIQTLLVVRTKWTRCQECFTFWRKCCPEVCVPSITQQNECKTLASAMKQEHSLYDIFKLNPEKHFKKRKKSCNLLTMMTELDYCTMGTAVML